MTFSTYNRYKTMNKFGSVTEFTFPKSKAELQSLLNACPNIPYIALAVLTPFEPPRDGSGGCVRQYPTGWALSHLKVLYKQYGAEEFITHLQMMHTYILQGGEVRNPIGLFTYRIRQNLASG